MTGLVSIYKIFKKINYIKHSVICYKKAMPKQDKANATNGVSR